VDLKSNIEEKRVKSTIIRRRTVAAPPPPPPEARESPVPEAASRPPVEASEVSKTPAGLAPESEVVSRPRGAAPVSVIPEAAAEVKPKKIVRKKSRDELEMEFIERAGGLKKAAEILTVMPERLERVYRPVRSANKKKKILSRKEFKKTELTVPKAIKKVIRIESAIAVGELAHRMGIKSAEVVKKLMSLGVMSTINQTIDTDTATLIAHDFGYEIENVEFEEKSVLKQERRGTDLRPRPPVVTVMGHVDHGKTSLLDQIRKSNVAAGEAGGITQHIGAYQVKLPRGVITFLDTPGHEAFTAMRSRGAQVTDIVILVVAADDGVMPQTIEAINHAKAAKVPIIVAVNKIDKPGADQARVERALMEHQLISEKLGGETIILPVSAKTGEGIPELLEMILLQSEVLELKADPSIRGRGVVIEAKLDRGRGAVATVIVREGVVRAGDPIVVGDVFGRVRLLVDSEGNQVREAGPSQPVEILGLSGIPEAGDMFDVPASEDDARVIAEHRTEKTRQDREYVRPRLEDLYAEAASVLPELRLVIKADVHGSAEALRDAVAKLSSEKVKVSVVHWGVGAVNESDVMLAVTSRAIVVAFNVRPDTRGREIAEREKVEIRKYSIIYDLLDDIRKAMEGLLQPLKKEQYLGRAEVRSLFKISKVGTVAGCSVVDGKIVRTSPVRVLRDGQVVYEGKLSSLKRFKEDAREVASGLECGLAVENFNDVKPGDLIEAYRIEEVQQKL